MKHPSWLFLGLLWLPAFVCESKAAPPLSISHEAKPRIVVMTDIGGDPDDEQSIVRFLLYSCDFQVEGFCTGFGHGHYERTRPELLHKAIDAYGKVLPNLTKHRRDYPSDKSLHALVKDGRNGDPHEVGPGMDSEASDWIIHVVDRDDPRPVWFSIWGGPRELAQAIWKVSQTRSKEELAKFKSKIRVHSIADQDRTAIWVKEHHPDVFWIFSDKLFRGIWKEGNQEIVSPDWLEKNVRTGHGRMGPIYPPKAAGKDGVKEGDTPSFFYVLPNGLSDPERPDWGNWGGRFRRSGRGNEWIPAEDLRDGRPDLLYTIHRWREAYQNEFEARMDWCVKPFDEANHKPKAVLNGDRTLGVLVQEAAPRQETVLDARGSSDPDGDELRFRWGVYQEAGTYWSDAAIRDAHSQQAMLTVPKEAAGRTLHAILEVTDTGRPHLTSYRRVIFQVSGDPMPPPKGAYGVAEDLSTPITRLEGPPKGTGQWEFYRGINVNGAGLQIDGHDWEGDSAEGFVCRDRALNSPEVPLLPPTDTARTRMIHSFRWGNKPILTIKRIPPGAYAIYAYVWEETESTSFSIRVNGKVVEPNYSSGVAGRWKRLGPWISRIVGGEIVMTASGGAANFSGLEIWRKAG